MIPIDLNIGQPAGFEGDTPPRPSFTCPDCKRTSYHPKDVQHCYCGNCHQYKAETYMPPRCFEPTCPDFGSFDFGEGTCLSEHATPPAWR